jgi:hypothetical protein
MEEIKGESAPKISPPVLIKKAPKRTWGQKVKDYLLEGIFDL